MWIVRDEDREKLGGIPCPQPLTMVGLDEEASAVPPSAHAIPEIGGPAVAAREAVGLQQERPGLRVPSAQIDPALQGDQAEGVHGEVGRLAPFEPARPNSGSGNERQHRRGPGEPPVSSGTTNRLWSFTGGSPQVARPSRSNWLTVAATSSVAVPGSTSNAAASSAPI
jgi:hypothetical protein